MNPSNSGHFIAIVSNMSEVIGKSDKGVLVSTGTGVSATSVCVSSVTRGSSVRVSVGTIGVSLNKCLTNNNGSDRFFSGRRVRAFGGARRKFLKSTPSGSESDPESDLGLRVGLLMTRLLVLSSAVGALASMKGLSCVQPRGEGSNLMTPANGH